MTRRLWLTAVALGLVVSALFWIGPIFFPLALAGPLAWGAFAGATNLPWRWPVAVAVVAGLGAVVSDYVINQEDVAFHLALTFTMGAFAWSAWSIAGRLTRADHRW
jgi:uncharacterized membrane protein YeiB